MRLRGARDEVLLRFRGKPIGVFAGFGTGTADGAQDRSSASCRMEKY